MLLTHKFILYRLIYSNLRDIYTSISNMSFHLNSASDFFVRFYSTAICINKFLFVLLREKSPFMAYYSFAILFLFPTFFLFLCLLRLIFKESRQFLSLFCLCLSIKTKQRLKFPKYSLPVIHCTNYIFEVI